MNALQKGVGETGCFPVPEIIKNRRFLKNKPPQRIACKAVYYDTYYPLSAFQEGVFSAILKALNNG